MDDLPSQPVASTSTAEPTLPPPGPSKTSLKKAAKKAERDATKLDRRRAERERKRAREAQRKQDIKEGKLTAEELEIFSGRKKLKNLRNESRKKGSLVSDVKCWKGGLIVDCGFDELMSENVSLFPKNIGMNPLCVCSCLAHSRKSNPWDHNYRSSTPSIDSPPNRS